MCSYPVLPMGNYEFKHLVIQIYLSDSKYK